MADGHSNVELTKLDKNRNLRLGYLCVESNLFAVERQDETSESHIPSSPDRTFFIHKKVESNRWYMELTDVSKRNLNTLSWFIEKSFNSSYEEKNDLKKTIMKRQKYRRGIQVEEVSACI